MEPHAAHADVASVPAAPRIGVVVIGRNEGERLLASLRALSPLALPVVYVDSASSDGSAARAQPLAAAVIELDASRPFTAARGRNAGHAYLRRHHPHVEFVQFVDGDTVLEPDWFGRAAATLQADGSIAAVAGRLEEGGLPDSCYGRLLQMEWDAPPGDTDSCGGIAMYRSSVLEAASGFADDLAAGEEPELCARLRRAGYRITRIDARMGVHHGAIGSFAAWWRRAVRSGEASWECLRRGGARWAAADLRRVASAMFWGGAAPATLLVGTIALVTTGRLVAAAALWLAGAGIYAWLWRRVCQARWGGGADEDDARLYATFCLLSKPAALLGILRAVWRGVAGPSAPSSGCSRNPGVGT